MNLQYDEMDKYVGELHFQILSRADCNFDFHPVCTKVFDYEILIKIQNTRAVRVFTLYCLRHISVTHTKSLYLNCTQCTGLLIVSSKHSAQQNKQMYCIKPSSFRYAHFQKCSDQFHCFTLTAHTQPLLFKNNFSFQRKFKLFQTQS